MQTELSSLVIGAVIFLASFISVEAGLSVAIIEIVLGAGAFTLFFAHWSVKASPFAGVALSTTSLAVVYSVLVETGLSRTELGKLLMAGFRYRHGHRARTEHSLREAHPLHAGFLFRLDRGDLAGDEVLPPCPGASPVEEQGCGARDQIHLPPPARLHLFREAGGRAGGAAGVRARVDDVEALPRRRGDPGGERAAPDRRLRDHHTDVLHCRWIAYFPSANSVRIRHIHRAFRGQDQRQVPRGILPCPEICAERQHVHDAP